MPRGGYRPGAGRKKNSVTALQAAAKAAGAIQLSTTAQAALPSGTPEPVAVLVAVMNGDAATPDGRPITPARVAAAKELLPFFTAKLATTNEKRGGDFDARTLSDDDLAAVVANCTEIIVRLGRTGAEERSGSSEGTPAAAPGEG